MLGWLLSDLLIVGWSFNVRVCLVRMDVGEVILVCGCLSGVVVMMRFLSVIGLFVGECEWVGGGVGVWLCVKVVVKKRSV